MKIQTPGTGGLARSISCHETGLPEKPPLQATRKGGKWRVVHPFRSTAHYSLTCNFDEPSSNIECKVELAYITIERNDKKMEHLPENLRNLRIPVIASPMFIISNPKLVIEQCKAGIVGSMPALNARPSSQLDEWLHEITEELEAYNKKHPDKPAAPFAINQIVHRSNKRLEQDMEIIMKYKVPIIITSLGAREEIYEAAHSY